MIRNRILLSAIFLCTLLTTGYAMADELWLKNGDHLTGTVVRMEDAVLIFNTSYAGDLSVKWEEISSIKTDTPIKVLLSDDTSIQGVTKPAEAGKMTVKMDKIPEAVSVNLSEVKSINPKPAEPPVKLNAQANVGFSNTSGNTDTQSLHFDGEFVARTTKNRYTVGAEYNRAEDKGEKTVDNSFGYLKYDHFLTEKWFFYTNATFEKDTFKDLRLRTTIGAGAGYQFYETPLMNLSAEAGLSYVDEDYDLGEDNSYPSGRWSLSFDRYFFDKFMQFFHFHELLIGFEDSDDLFLRTRQGLRFALFKNLRATFQYNYDYDKSPQPGREKEDETFLITLGFAL